MSILPSDSGSPPVLSWLRLNLSIVVFVASLGSGVFGAVVTGTLRVAHYDFRLDTMERARIVLAERMDAIEADRRSRDAEHETAAKDIAERRIKLARDLGDVYQRLSVLEQQTKQTAALEVRVSDDDQQFAQITARLAVLESKNAWLGGFIQENLLPRSTDKRR